MTTETEAKLALTDVQRALANAKAELAERESEFEQATAEEKEVEAAWLRDAEKPGAKLAHRRQAVAPAGLRVREAEHLIVVARRKVEEAYRAAAEAEVADQRDEQRQWASDAVKLGKKLDRHLKAVVEDIEQRLELGDRGMLLRVDGLPAPQAAHMRADPYLAGIILGRLAQVLPGVSRNRGWWGMTVYRAERKYLAPWLKVEKNPDQDEGQQ